MGEIIIDGKDKDDAWNTVQWNDNFTQQSPNFGEKPSQKTAFKILYDEKNLYVCIRAYDSSPEEIVKRMSRRDGFDGDWVKIHFDSYHDKRTAFVFTATVAGVKGDQYISNNGGNWDSTWDPIWYLKTSIDDKGWIAEMKIPLTQLRFATKENNTWGLQVVRKLFRKDEISHWQLIDRNAPGWVHLFGELNGLKNLKAQNQLEIQPFVVAGIEKYKKEEGNPFKTGKGYILNTGVDAKIGITSDITLDLTVNPDFGQVEADPSVVNLTALEQFFQERRPFFLEGNNLFDFYVAGGNNLFYSRRIGRKPQGKIPSDSFKHEERTPKGRILGSAKITGKNKNGFSWGVLESFTDKISKKVIDTLLSEKREKIEPYTNYLVGRAQQDINGGNTIVGMMLTNTNRIGNQGNELEKLHDNAQSLGIDVAHGLWDRKYKLNFASIISNVQGSEKSILKTQKSNVRLFHRENNVHRNVDSTLTSLTGSAIQSAFGKEAGKFTWKVGLNYRSPQFEINDVGFLSKTDIINIWAFSRYRVNEIKGIFRKKNIGIGYEQELDFGGTNLLQSIGGRFNAQFTNFWSFESNLKSIFIQTSNSDLRGGPSITYPMGINGRFVIKSNPNKKFSYGIGFRFSTRFKNTSDRFSTGFRITYRPIDALNISIRSRYEKNHNTLQYITQKTNHLNTKKYILATINQETFQTSLRVNYNISPNLTIEFWGQPFISKGIYTDFKNTNIPHSKTYEKRFKAIEDPVFSAKKNTYSIFDTNNQILDYDFKNPDFSKIQLRSNLVMRWEYIPGSTLFFAWSSNGSKSIKNANQNLNQLSNDLFDLGNSNTFIIKYTYRFIL